MFSVLQVEAGWARNSEKKEKYKKITSKKKDRERERENKKN